VTSIRRLTAILAADVAGYSRLMGTREEETHERLNAHLTELVNPKIAEHKGRVVKNTGDGFLAEFASVVDAVRCAAEIQRGMADREPEVAEEQRIRFRIGINLGDVIAEDEDIFGDGVNVAARLEALADPGEICLSRVVRDQVRDRLDYTFEDLGEQQVKNIARPVRAYALRLGAVANPTAEKVPSATPISQPVAAPRLSIVVLPFANLSNDPEQGYFADGLTEDLTTDLSRIADMLVISRNSAFTYKDKSVNAKQIGRKLGVRYVLEGSVRRSGNRVRVSAQLVDAETDAHLWAERLDGDMSDLFALQDEITSRIAIALNRKLIGAEAARPIENPDAVDYIFRARAAMLKPLSRENYAEAISFYDHALALDPRSVEAQSWLAIALTGRVLDAMTGSAKSDINRAEELIGQALAASPDSAAAHFAKGLLLNQQGRPDEAALEFDKVLAFNRNWVGALFQLGVCKALTGSLDEAISLAEQAILLSPHAAGLANFYWFIGGMHLAQSHTGEAVLWLEKARAANPTLAGPRAFLASAYALKAETEHAFAELAEARRLSRDDQYSSIARLQAAGLPGSRGYWGVPKVRALFEATYFAGLRKAGMSEE